MDREMTPVDGHSRYLLVRTGNVRCALPASDVARVVRHLRCHPVPGSSDRLVGLAQYGGDPLPVLDLHALVEGRASNARHQSTVILGRDRDRVRAALGLAVDEAVRVIELPETADINADPGAVASSVETEDGSVIVVNTGHLLSDEKSDTGATDG